MTWEEVKELGSLYAIGALDEETACNVENFLRTATPEQKSEMAEWQEIAAAIPMALAERPVPVHIREQLLLMTDESSAQESSARENQSGRVLPFQTKARSQSPIVRWMLMAATLTLAASCGYLAWQNNNISLQLKETDHKLNTLTRQLEVFLSPSTRIISMNGVETPKAHAKVVWNTESQTWEVHIKNLPAPPNDKDYQLWYVTKDAKINAAVFSTDDQGRSELKLRLPAEAINGLSATAVTLEPKGGSPQPTGKFYLLASI